MRRWVDGGEQPACRRDLAATGGSGKTHRINPFILALDNKKAAVLFVKRRTQPLKIAP